MYDIYAHEYMQTSDHNCMQRLWRLSIARIYKLYDVCT